MDVLICDSTAFRYWRIPPIAQLLAAAPEADIRLAKVLSGNDLELLSARALRACEKFAKPHCGNAGELYRTMLDAVPLLSLCGDGPFDLLSKDNRDVRRSSLVEPKVWSAGAPVGGTREATELFGVTSPEFTLQQLAARASLERTLLLASELCGGFSVFRPPAEIAGVIQRLCNRGVLPKIGGWEPCLSGSGKLTDLWKRPPLTTPSDLKHLAETSDSSRGRARLSLVADLVTPDAASPFEVQAGILLGLSARRGGAGLDGFKFNHKVWLTPDAALLSKRGSCSCDLYWDEGLDVECHSITWHAERDSQLSDFARETALELMGIEVLPITYEQLSSPRQFDAIVRIITSKLGRKQPAKTKTSQAAANRLWKEVLKVDWLRLPDV
ncbi:hypothetical protein [Paratractidigestivibacter sp.]|uniref:hypothetical protein n=1 Tax=Paratractidigestivibacter sp. TaxID=2847316 RepID=UPI002ABE4378|nr:hypothetical protein [Paratractidigestivibacter sp.]